MTTSAVQYKDHELVKKAIEIRTKFLALKDQVHRKDIRLQQKVRTRKEWISDAKVFTQMRDMAIRVAKAVDKKTSPKTGDTPLRVVQVDDTLAEFLQLKTRGFRPIIDHTGNKRWYYSDTLVMSYFANWVVATGRQDGRNVKLDEHNDAFVALFSQEMKQDKVGPILDANGKQVHPFVSNKYMTMFAPHYPRSMNKEGKLVMSSLSKDEYPEAHAKVKRERELLTGPMKKARNEYKDALKRYRDLEGKKDQASKVGDNTLYGAISDAEALMLDRKRAYMRLLNENDFEHRLNNHTH